MMRDKKSMMKHNDATMMRIYTVIFPMMMSHHEKNDAMIIEKTVALTVNVKYKNVDD